MPLKIGDEVEVIELIGGDRSHGVRIGDTFIITDCDKEGDYLHGHPKKDGKGAGYILQEQVKLVQAKLEVTKKSMNRTQFRAYIAEIFQKGLALIDKKNADYAGEDDPFANFNNASIAHVSVPQAILVRISDKMSRIGNLLVRPAVVLDESLEDTIIDAINYLAILLAWLESQKNK